MSIICGNASVCPGGAADAQYCTALKPKFTKHILLYVVFNVILIAFVLCIVVNVTIVDVPAVAVV